MLDPGKIIICTDICMLIVLVQHGEEHYQEAGKTLKKSTVYFACQLPTYNFLVALKCEVQNIFRKSQNGVVFGMSSKAEYFFIYPKTLVIPDVMLYRTLQFIQSERPIL